MLTAGDHVPSVPVCSNPGGGRSGFGPDSVASVALTTIIIRSFTSVPLKQFVGEERRIPRFVSWKNGTISMKRCRNNVVKGKLLEDRRVPVIGNA